MKAKSILPILGREDIEEHVNKIIEKEPGIRDYVQKNPQSRQLLYETAKDIYHKNSRYLTGAKLIDSWDRLTSAASLAGEAVAGAGQAASVLEEVVEGIPKVGYALYYSVKTGDYKAIPYFMAVEAASLIPIVGDIIDMSNLYINRARKTFRRKVAESFLERIALRKN
ncbi:MAG: hypothetical protein HYT62_01175 [Candidatus Yanofskybacteria bacterium]|nr:hypothetical protein [Candidatus Yanofskybacteria bacterium]